MQGLMDTDGFVSKSGYCCYNTKSKQLADDICFLVRSLGGIATIHEKNCRYFNKKYNELRDCGIQYEVSFGLFNYEIKVYILEKKQSRVKYLTKSKFHKFIDKVEYLRDDDAVCFLVDAKDHLFLTRDFNVTHNTSFDYSNGLHAAAVVLKVLTDCIWGQNQTDTENTWTHYGIEAKDLSEPEWLIWLEEQSRVVQKKKGLRKTSELSNSQAVRRSKAIESY